MEQHGTDPLVGSLIDQRYRVKSRLARGGMSTVYRAEDIRLERDVALKVLYPHLAEDPSFLDRFRLEATSAAKLSHPHVVSVLDQGLDGHLAYLVMEFVPGHTLRDLLEDKGALTPRLALALLDPVIEGLGAAHAAGLVHRDVKPENVLMSVDGRIKIGDFGLARAASAHTSTGALVGTVAYLSPELVSGSGADARSDIYAIGIMLFEMLTGRQPFLGDVPIQVAFQHVNGTVPAPSTLVPGLAEDLDELVQWCTAPDPEDRPLDGNALLGELRHIRTSLSDAQLDLPAPPAAGGTTASATELPAVAGPASATEVIPRTEAATTIIAAGHRPTQALPRQPGVPQGQHDGGPTARTVAKAAKRDFRAQQRQWKKDAQQPQARLHAGNSVRRGWLWTAVIVLLTAAVAIAAWFFGLGPGAAVAVPDMTGKPAAVAEAELSGLGLTISRQSVFDEVIAKDLVIGTDPSTPAQIRKFRPVALIVSKGPELFAVPNVLGRNAGAAAADIGDASLLVGSVAEEFSDSVAPGLVVSQNPSADEQLRRNSPVDLVFSKGPRPIPVPNVLGKPAAEAAALVSAAGLMPATAPEQVFDREVPAGSVLGQEPAGGQLRRGDTVTLTISKGPRLIQVPDVSRLQVDEARKELEDLGFKVEINALLPGGIFFGTVRSQDPADESLPEGSTITLNVV